MKKKQHSLNFLIITLINGKIIFCSNGYDILQDQSLWNELGLRNFFIGKEYGVIGDGGFYFNPKGISPKIKGFFFFFFLSDFFLIFFRNYSF